MSKQNITPFGISYDKDGFPIVNSDVLYDFLGYTQFVNGIVQKNPEGKGGYEIRIPVPKRSEPKTDDDHITLSLRLENLDPLWKKQLEREDNPAKSRREEVSAYLEHFAAVGIISGKVSFSTEYEYLDYGDNAESTATPKFYVWDIPHFDAGRLSELVETGYRIYSARARVNIDEIIENMMSEDRKLVVPAQDIDEYLTAETEELSVAAISSDSAYYHPKELLRGENDKPMILSVRTVEQILALMKRHGVYEKLAENSADMIGSIVNMVEMWAIQDRFALYSVEYFLYAVWYLNDAFYWNRFVRACETLFGAGTHFVYDLRALLGSDGLSRSALAKAPNPVPVSPTKKSGGEMDIDFANEGERISFGDIFFTKERLRIGMMEIYDKEDRGYYVVSIVGRIDIDPHYENITREEVVSKDQTEMSKELSDHRRSVYKGLYAIIKFGKDIPMSGLSQRREYSETDGTITFSEHMSALGKKFPKLATERGLSAGPQLKNRIKKFLSHGKSKCSIVEKITNMALVYDPAGKK